MTKIKPRCDIQKMHFLIKVINILIIIMVVIT